MAGVETRARRRASTLLGIGFGALVTAMGANPAVAQSATASSAPAEAEPQSSATPSAGQSANSPQTSAQTEQLIVVTGVRASVGSALTLQRTATQLQQSIVAEDIGKLPDNNVVEALQHVTGVSIIRNNVEPGVVLIRGLPDIATTLNGRQLFSSAGRFVSLPDLPAELLARVDVKKASSADDIEGGIAGLIDVSLHRPFDFQRPQLAGSVKATYGSLSMKWAPNASILASDRWNTGIGEIGALVNLSYQKRLVSTDRIAQNQSTLRRAGVPGAGSGPGTGVAAGAVATPSTVTLTQADTQIERAALSASLQWAPSPNVELYVDYFYSQLRNQAPVDVNVLLLGTCPNAAETKPFPGTNIGQVLPSGCFGLTSMQDRRTREDTQQIATGLTWNVNDRLTIKAQGNYTHSKDKVWAYIMDAQYNYASQPNGLIVTLNPANDGGVFVDQPGNPQMSPNNYLDQWYDTRNPRSGHEWSGRIDLAYKVSDESFLRSIDAGYRYNTRSAISDNAFTGLNCALTTGDGSNAYQKYRLAALNSQACTAYRAQSGPQPFSAATQRFVGGISYGSLGMNAYHQSRGSFFDGKYGTNSWVNLDPNWLWDNAEKMRNLFGYSGPFDFVPTNHFDVTETSNAGYVKANFGTMLGSMELDGNVGLRVIRTTLTENAFTQKYVPLDPTLSPTQGANATCVTCLVYTPAKAIKSDTQWLPSLNLRLRIVDGLYLRADAGRTVTRPTFTQLNPGLNVSAATATLLGTASSGNADLTPVKSTNYDLDLTYYWHGANHIGVSLFYRQVKGYIQTRQSNVVIEGLNYILSRPENFQDANIKGVEAGYSQFLDFLPGAFKGFGWDVNATYIEAPFNNVAKYHVNASGIYERGPVSLRLSYTWNAPYRVADFATGAQPQAAYASTRVNMDFSANFRINKNVTLSFDATNLLDNYQREHAGDGDMNALLFPTVLARYDRTFSLGFRMKL